PHCARRARAHRVPRRTLACRSSRKRSAATAPQIRPADPRAPRRAAHSATARRVARARGRTPEVVIRRRVARPSRIWETRPRYEPAHRDAGEAIEEERRMGRYAHVIWDWNGTLLDDVALCLDIMNRMLDQRGMRRIEPVRYRQIFDFPVQLYYSQLGFDFDAEPFEDLAASYCDQYDARVIECALQHNARRLLERLSDRGVS